MNLLKYPLVKKVKNFFDKHFSLLLILIALISYGQMLQMYVWQDDNALFFKLAHINEGAGYFGVGPFGSGVYRYAATPFIPIYQFFGFTTEAYFGLALILYAIATIVVYKTFLQILGKTGGKIAGFLYAAGYVVSDGYWRLANSVTTSISIIIASLLLLSYWKFYNDKKPKWYVVALILFYLSIEVSLARMHYFFAVVVAFEILFLAFKKPIQSLIFSGIRLLPFAFLFFTRVAGADPRAGGVKDFVLAGLHGEWYKYYGYLGSIANIVVPDWVTNWLFEMQKWIDSFIHFHVPFIRFLLLVVPAAIIVKVLLYHPQKKILIPAFLMVLFIWVIAAKDLFTTPLLTPGLEQYFIVALGGITLLLSVLFIIVAKKQRSLFLLLVIWMLGNIAAYSAYNTSIPYGTIDRYLAHSFVPLVGIFAILYLAFPRKQIFGKIGMVIILTLGIGNIINAVLYEHLIVQARSIPARSFFNQLKTYLPNAQKGDIFYFDLADNAQGYYRDAIATAMMPETTALAWRYGIDRYDIRLTNNFNDLTNLVAQGKITSDHIHTFWYSKDGLFDTSNSIRSFFTGNKGNDQQEVKITQSSQTVIQTLGNQTKWTQQDLLLPLSKPIESVTPKILSVTMAASPLDTTGVQFPLRDKSASPTSAQENFWNNLDNRVLAFDYVKYKQTLLSGVKVSVSSEWQNKVAKNVIDQDPTSAWQSDRTQWGLEKTFVELELSEVQILNRFAWINGSPTSTPTHLAVEVSTDNKKWQRVKEVSIFNRIENQSPQVVSFDPVQARFIRMVMLDTLNGDSPVISEVWPIPAKYSNLDITLAEQYAKQPFLIVASREAFIQTMRDSGGKGGATLYWIGDKTKGWQTNKAAQLSVIYDGKPHAYEILLPAGGMQISALKFSDIMIPGTINVLSIQSKQIPYTQN